MPSDKMVMAIVERGETLRVLEALVAAGFGATFNDSRGGFLRTSKQTLFVAVEAEKVDDVLSIIRENCHSHIALDSTEGDTAVEETSTRSFAEVGSAVVFVWDIDRFETYF
jgi:uncharacterized protein YaaQ